MMLVIDTFFIFLVQTDTNLIYIVGVRTTFIRFSFHLRNAYTVTDDNTKHQEYTSNYACNEEGGIPNEHDAAFAFMLEKAKKMGLERVK